MNIITDPDELTPVEKIDWLYIKREDLFRPFGEQSVNGGKLRQCYCLIDKVKDDYDGVISCCSIYSPQSPITAATAHHFGLPCIICYGGTSEERLRQYRMPTIARRYGAKSLIISKSGIHKILYGKARPMAEELNYYVVDYGINITQYPDVLFDAVSKQVENIPDDLDNLVITCGSGITTTGVLLGLKRYKKNVGRIVLVATAPNRRELIDRNLAKNGASASYEIADLFHQKGFKYEKGLTETIGDLKLHPNYEAKTFNWIKRNIDRSEKTLLWNVGVKPMR